MVASRSSVSDGEKVKGPPLRHKQIYSQRCLAQLSPLKMWRGWCKLNRRRQKHQQSVQRTRVSKFLRRTPAAEHELYLSVRNWLSVKKKIIATEGKQAQRTVETNFSPQSDIALHVLHVNSSPPPLAPMIYEPECPNDSTLRMAKGKILFTICHHDAPRRREIHPMTHKSSVFKGKPSDNHRIVVIQLQRQQNRRNQEPLSISFRKVIAFDQFIINREGIFMAAHCMIH